MKKKFKDKKDDRKYRRGAKDASKDERADNDDKDFTAPKATTFPTHNDASWYKADEVYARNVANIPFSMRVGDNFSLTGPNANGSAKITSVAPGIPGIMVLRTIPNFNNGVRDYSGGNVSTEADAVNTAANGLYAYIRSANAGSKNYEKSDLMMLCIALGELVKGFSFATKVFGLVQYYSQINKYVGRSICTALHVDYNDIVANLPQYRAGLNLLLRRASVLTVPHLDYFNRQFWLYRGVFSDDEDVERGQYYTFEPLALLQYEADFFTTGTSLGRETAWASAWSSTGGPTDLTSNVILTSLENLVNALVYDDDVALMCGDIRKAFTEGNVYAFWQIPEDYQVRPEYNKEALMQIHNASIVASPTENTAIYYYEGSNGGKDLNSQGDTPATATLGKNLTHGVFQIDNRIYGAACIARGAAIHNAYHPNSTSYAELDSHYLSCEEAEPGVDTVLESTRLMSQNFTFVDGSSIKTIITASGGTEVVWDISIYNFDNSGILNNMSINSALTSGQINTGAALVDAFHDHPMVLLGNSTSWTISNATAMTSFWQYETFTVIDTTVLMGIHNSAMFGLFVPRQSFISSNRK